MTVSGARAALEDSLRHTGHGYESVREVRFHRNSVTFVCDSKYYDDKWNDTLRPVKKSVRIATPKSVSNGRDNGLYWTIIDGHKTGFPEKKYAIMFADAMHTLSNALAPDTEEADFAAFSSAAQRWRDTTPKPDMPDEARAYKGLAEDAFKRKDYDAAFTAYCEALDRYPMWPSGHYNAALLAAEDGDYELAAQHMHRYLVLAPDATDAAAAKDKFLLWQLKAKQ